MGFMAADRQVTTNDGEIMIACETKIERIGEYLVGAAGLEGPAEHFLEWMRFGDWDDPPSPWETLSDEDSFSILILGPEGIFVVDKFMRMTPIHHRWYAVGTGGPLAWAVLEAGCGIDLAMETALRLDPSSGFGFQVRHRKEADRKHDRDVGY